MSLRGFLPIPGFENYFISNDGVILSKKGRKEKILKQINKKTGYLYVFLYVDKKSIKKYVHDLVLLTFCGAATYGKECRHLDGRPDNNSYKNLCWGTKKENSDDKIKHHTVPCGEKAGTHKLTESDVLYIRKMHGKLSLRKLASIFGVSHTAIRRAALGIKWAYLKAGY